MCLLKKAVGREAVLDISSRSHTKKLLQDCSKHRRKRKKLMVDVSSFLTKFSRVSTIYL